MLKTNGTYKLQITASAGAQLLSACVCVCVYVLQLRVEHCVSHDGGGGMRAVASVLKGQFTQKHLPLFTAVLHRCDEEAALCLYVIRLSDWFP